MSKLNENCIFISATENENIDELRNLIYEKAKDIHITRFPYNDFLFHDYEEEAKEFARLEKEAKEKEEKDNLEE